LIADAARLQLNGMDGMRFLGADPRTAADDIEAVVMVWVSNQMVRDTRDAHG
jgi:hypothetical protein